ncbi:Hypothetical predicted protein [Olea europaea subsp. europaea]|uniref:ABC transmembrane type-1 domain-containing protein n=1 Tax=Olea europaea subsp. europaea TaxID=158383 RepID=A0A8S0PVT8_OLEEU|nr:Hypothetical predicted protein [Olea europaea subsp. europaea]
MLLAMPTTWLLQAVMSTVPLLLQAALGSNVATKLFVVNGINFAVNSGERYLQQLHNEAYHYVDGIATTARGALVRICTLVMLLLDLGCGGGVNLYLMWIGWQVGGLEEVVVGFGVSRGNGDGTGMGIVRGGAA